MPFTKHRDTQVPPSLPLLGKLPKREDPRTLKLSAYVDAQAALDALPTLQPLNLVGAAGSVPMYNNDKWGDCGPAGMGHAVNTWRAAKARAGRTKVPAALPQSSVTAFYVAVTTEMGQPFNPTTGENDTGVVLLDMLKVAAKKGIGGHKIGGFVDVDLTDELYNWASAAFGGLILGYNLPTIVQDMRPWTFAPPNLHGAYAPGSWGGHCVFEDANDLAGNRVVETWGGEKNVGEAYDKAYRDEAWACLSTDQMLHGKDVVSGLALADLKSDLEKVQAK